MSGSANHANQAEATFDVTNGREKTYRRIRNSSTTTWNQGSTENSTLPWPLSALPSQKTRMSVSTVNRSAFWVGQLDVAFGRDRPIAAHRCAHTQFS